MPALSIRSLATVGSLLLSPVIGHNGAAEVDTSSSPFSAIGMVKSGNTDCAGFLVGPRHIVTAAHCYQGENETTTFSPGYNNGSAVHGTYTVKTVYHGPFGRLGNDRPTRCGEAYEYTILLLGENDRIGDRLGFFEVGTANPGKNYGPHFQTAGYRTDLPQAHGLPTMYWQNGLKMYGSLVDCHRPNGPLVTEADTYEGQSGSPLWLNMNGTQVAYGLFSDSTLPAPEDLILNVTLVTGGNRFFLDVKQAKEDYP